MKNVRLTKNSSKPRPTTYDMTFCVSNCKNKCDRHYSLYSFDRDRLYSMCEFNCKDKEWSVDNGR